jgi:soluble lytic murein transglycosylase
VTKTGNRFNSVYERTFGERVLGSLALVVALVLAAPGSVRAAPPGVDPQAATVLDAREALRKRDRKALAVLRQQANAEANPLALWVEYWELFNRLNEAQQPELNAFADRWSGSYVEDRLRNDWLLELGRRRDWANFSAEFPRFRMADDRQVTCYSLVTEQIAGRDIKAAGIAAWMAQKEEDDGCALLAAVLVDTRQLASPDIWKKIRLSAEAGKPRAARQAAVLLGASVATSVAEIFDGPARYLGKKAQTTPRVEAELAALALTRLAATDSESVAGMMVDRWEKALPSDLAAWTWASIARQSAIKLQPEAADQFLRAERISRKPKELELPDDLLAWKVRAALRADGGKPRWQQVMQAIDAMTPAEQKDPAWVYWKARALQALAKDSQEGEALKTSSRELMTGIAGQLNFYGQLAAEDLGQPQSPPPRPAPLTPAERDAVASQPGFARALALISMGLRSEGVREWNFSIRGLSDRELLAAAQLACDREVWDRCINTSDRTREEIDMEQRFPSPLRQDVVARAREIGLDPAFVYGLIRQESRFIMDARSGVGASGLMQLMPATARWTAKKIGLPYSPSMITDRDTNLRLGNAYLKLVLDDVGGSQAMAAAAYNAGPGRPRKWREGPVLEPAIWAENIPFNETRDYVKKVLSNAAYYAMALGGKGTTIRSRLGRPVGPPDPNAPPADKELP